MTKIYLPAEVLLYDKFHQFLTYEHNLYVGQSGMARESKIYISNLASYIEINSSSLPSGEYQGEFVIERGIINETSFDQSFTYLLRILRKDRTTQLELRQYL
jgi:glutamine cyclotransferase